MLLQHSFLDWLEAVGSSHLSFLALSVVTLAVFTSTAYVLYQRAFSPLADYPGPYWASLSPLWKLYMFRKGNFHETILELHLRYGSIVRIAPYEVVISDRSAIREIYSTTEGKEFLKVCLSAPRGFERRVLTSQVDELLRVRKLRNFQCHLLTL